MPRSNALAGLPGLVQLGPVVACGLAGGAAAGRVDRKRLLMGSEALMALCVARLPPHAPLTAPKLFVICALVAVLQGASGFHRPALQALTQKLARPDLMGASIVAMAFAFPIIALLPAMAAACGRSESVGWLRSAMSVGALVIAAQGFAPSLTLALVCLAGVVVTRLALPLFWAYRSSVGKGRH